MKTSATKSKKSLGVNMLLHKPGKDRDVTEKREKALELIDHPEKAMEERKTDDDDV